ncbi:hypothetical protein DYB36_002019 [Aphanomyces astaci]|uniref:Sister chromatid cohesion protein n=2 Tax=Aphanomyces astaci TaxID=112090 RepID=A0A397BPB8_APHAT|nr:hypothetical protein DYB36_002019 [Aphanomyces astaci]
MVYTRPDHNPPVVQWDTLSPLLRTVVTDVPVLSPNVNRPHPPSKQYKTPDNVHDVTTPERKRRHESSNTSDPKNPRLSRVKVIQIADDDDDDEEGPSTPVPGDTQESKKKAIVHKYEEELHSLVGRLSTSPDVPRVTKKIMQSLQLLHKAHKDLIQHVSFDLLGNLICMLYIMTAPNIDRRLLSEEYIEHCVHLLKHVLQRLLCPSLDNLVLSQLLQDAKSAVHPKYHGALKKKIDKVGLVHVTSAFMETVEELVTGLKLQDSWILSLSRAVVDTFSLEGSQASQANICLLQVRASVLVRGLFLHNPTHRPLLMDDIFAVLLKLPTTKRHMRTFKLSSHGGDVHVQMISMMLVTLAQASVRVSMDAVRDTARVIVHSLVQKCMKKDESHDFRQTFEHFVDDLLAMLPSPEWPAVHVILEALSGGLTNLMAQQKTNKLESQSSLLALHLLGKICASIRQIACQAKAHPIDTLTHPPALVECRDHARQLLASKHVNDSNANVAQCMVLMFLGDQSAHLSVDAEEFHRAQCAFSDEFRALKANVTLSNAVGRVLVTELVSHRDLCLHFDQMLMAIMTFLTRGQPTFRARVLKALGMIVDCDPLLMADDHLHQAITLSLSDEATSVRQSAVELVGKYIGLQSMLFPKYFAMLADRLRDKGISVRKSVLKIFKTYLQHTPMNPNDEAECVSKALRALVERIGVASEDESVKDAVLAILQDVWFGSSSRRSGHAAHHQDTVVTPASLRKKAAATNYKVLSMIDVVHHVHNPDWMVTLIGRLMSKNAVEIESACAAMVSELMEFLLQLEEGHTLPLLSFDGNAQRVATLKTLHVICQASPRMVLPYLDTLTVYLKQDDRLTKPTQMHVLAMAAAMIGLVLPSVEKPVEKWMVQLENDLKSLVLGAPPQVVKPAVDCLATLTTSGLHRPPKLLLKILEMLYAFLVKNPRMLLKAQQDHTLQTMILHPDPKVRTQILASLTDLLQGEEARLEKLHATQGTKVGKDQVQGDQEGDASLIGGVMQAQLPNMLKVATQKEASIRTQAIACIGLLLTQGLIAPMQCIPTLVALETDQLASVRDTAYLHLVAIHSKFPNMVSGPAIQGIFSSYQFQTRAFGKAIVCDTDNVVRCYLGRMYRACIQGNRSQRHAFFNGLLGAFRERGPVFTALAANRLTPAVALGYLTYVAQVLSAMPYDVEDEPLYVVYTINRDVALGLGCVCVFVKKYLGDDTTLDNLPEPDAPIKPEVAAVGPTAFALALLANETPVSRTTAAHDSTLIPMNVDDITMAVVGGTGMSNGWTQLKLLGEAAAQDQAQLDFDWEHPQLTKKKAKLPKRGGQRKRKQANDEDENDLF